MKFNTRVTQKLLPFVSLIVLFVALSIASPYFLTANNLASVARQTAVFNTMALGMTWGVGTLIMLFYNGVILGAVSADYILGGQGVFLAGWLLPHGSIEIPSILLGGQAGFILAGLGTVLLGPILPILLHQWQLTDAQGGVLISAKFLGAFLGGVTVLPRLRFAILTGCVLCCCGFGAFARCHSLAPAAVALFFGGLGRHRAVLAQHAADRHGDADVHSEQRPDSSADARLRNRKHMAPQPFYIKWLLLGG